MPGPGKIRWLVSQQKRLKDAVRKYNAAITRMKNSGKYDVVPNYVSYENEKKGIHTRYELYQREKELNRILLKNNSKAQDVVTVNDVTMPRYLKDEIRYSKQAINRRRENLIHRLYPDFDEMSRPEQGSVLANKNLNKVKGNYFTPEDLDLLKSQQYINYDYQMDIYISEWENLSDNRDVPRIINRFRHENPQAFYEIMEREDMETSLDYIYPPGRSANMEAMASRHKKVIDYWEYWENVYFGSNE